jgi:acyl-CoA thioester hydrolase
MLHQENFEVRDNELDAQGVVNNANYFVYMAHARHKYIALLGLNFDEMARRGQNCFLISSTIEFKQPLRSGNKFYIISKLMPEGKIKFAFKQQIFREDKMLIAEGYNICVCIDETNRRRPYIPQKIAEILAKSILTK